MSWPDYVKEVSRRSKAGYSSVHNELLQRFGTAPAKDLGYRNIETKQQTKQNRMSSIFFRNKSKSKDGRESNGVMKPKERKNSLRQTFISYVEEGDDNVENGQNDTETENVFGQEKQEETVVLNVTTDLDEQILKNICDGKLNASLLKTETFGQDSTGSEPNTQDAEQAKSKSPLTSKRHLSPKRHFTEEAIYQVPRSSSGIENHTSFEDMVGGNDQHLYSNMEKFPESGHYEVPKSPRSLEDISVYSDVSVTSGSNMIIGNEDEIENHVPLYDNAKQTDDTANMPHPDDDYIDMQGTIGTALSRGRYKSCSAIEGKLGAKYENTTNVLETLQIQTTNSAPTSPLLRSSKRDESSTESGQIVTDAADANSEANEYVGPDPVERETTKTPQSATVAPYIPENEPHTTSLPSSLITRPFVEYTVEEVVECFEICSLPQVAKVCKEESLDGEYFKDLNDSDLAAEPFCLSQFHVSKLRKIIAGWRPKRLTY